MQLYLYMWANRKKPFGGPFVGTPLLKLWKDYYGCDFNCISMVEDYLKIKLFLYTIC